MSCSRETKERSSDFYFVKGEEMGDLNVLGDGETDSSTEKEGKERSRKYLCVFQLKDGVSVCV